jgi:hypothetical protein
VLLDLFSGLAGTNDGAGNRTSKETKPAPRWQQWGSAAAAFGVVQWSAGLVNDLTATFGVAPAALIAAVGGLVVCRDHTNEDRAFDVVAGLIYPCAGITLLDGTETTADKVLFLYNHPETL